jgi:hypothetical protein
MKCAHRLPPHPRDRLQQRPAERIRIRTDHEIDVEFLQAGSHPDGGAEEALVLTRCQMKRLLFVAAVLSDVPAGSRFR